MTNTNRRSILGALAALWPAVALGKGDDDTTDDTTDDGGCHHDGDCAGGFHCEGGTCVPDDPPGGGGPGGCDGAANPIECCREAVKRGCRRGGGGQAGHGQGGGHCRRRGFARCRQNFPV